MQNLAQTPIDKRLQLLSGVISDYRCSRKSANFVFSDADKSSLGVIAVAASLAGASGLAASTAASATAEEEADYLEFTLNGYQIKGWVWRSPFENGDNVELIVELRDGYYEAFAIARARDRIVALYPHCSRGRARHWMIVVWWWLIGSTITTSFGAIGFLLIGAISSRPWIKILHDLALVPGLAAVIFPSFLVMSISLGWKRMSFVRLAERIFKAFGWEYSATIDLKKRSRISRTADDGPGYGIFYFRY